MWKACDGAFQRMVQRRRPGPVGSCFVAEVVGDLTVQGRLDDSPGQPLRQPAHAGEPQPVPTSPINQHREQLLILTRTHRLRGRLLNDDLGCHLASLP